MGLRRLELPTSRLSDDSPRNSQAAPSGRSIVSCSCLPLPDARMTGTIFARRPSSGRHRQIPREVSGETCSSAAIVLGLTMTPAFGQNVPELPFESVPDPLKLPNDIHFGEIAGRSGQFEWACLRVLARQLGRSVLHGHRLAAPRVRRQRQLPSRDRQEPECVVLRTRRSRRSPRQHLGRRQGIEHDPQVQARGSRGLGLRP